MSSIGNFMTYMVILWLLMGIFWFMIVSRNMKRVRDAQKRGGNFEKSKNIQKQKSEVSLFETQNKRKSIKERRKHLKDSGLIDDNEYDIRDL